VSWCTDRRAANTHSYDRAVPSQEEILEALAGSSAPEYTAAIRVVTTAMSLARLTNLLGEPSRGRDIGDPVSASKPDGAKRAAALWLRKTGLERSRALDEHVVSLVEVIEARRDGFNAVAEIAEIDIFCGVFRNDSEIPLTQGVIVRGCGFSLDDALLARMSELGLTLTVDVY
jgi:hypothetical protein